MMPEFDEHSDNYELKVRRSISFIKKEHDFFILEQYKLLKKNLISANSKILDFGCGVGTFHRFFAKDDISLTGIDVSSQSLQVAKKKFPKNQYLTYDGEKIPFPDNTFDTCFATGVLHHVPPDCQRSLMLELYRVLKFRGQMLVIEHNPFNPLTRVAVNNCEFDKDAVLLTHFKTQQLFHSVGYKNVRSEYFLFFPFSNSLSNYITKKLSWFPLGAKYLTKGYKY